MSLRLSEVELNRIQTRIAANTGKPKPEPIKKKQTRRGKLEADLTLQLNKIGIEVPNHEYRFHSIREWRFDLAWPDLRFAVEVDGLVHDGKGGHQTFTAVTEDCQKAAEAMLWGWQVYRCTQAMLKSGEAADHIRRLLARRVAQVAKLPPELV